jgi:shikimate kinase
VRPLLKTADPLQTLTEIYNQRRDRYAQADISIMVTGHESAAEVSERLLAMIETRIAPDRLKQEESN